MESHAIVKLTMEHIAPVEFKPREGVMISSVSGGMKPILGRHLLSYASFVSTLVGFEIPSVINGFIEAFPRLYSYTVQFPMNSAIQNLVDDIINATLSSKTLGNEVIANFISKIGILEGMPNNHEQSGNFEFEASGRSIRNGFCAFNTKWANLL